MVRTTTHKIFIIFIACVWLLNGLVCKVLNLVPRHQDIVAWILGDAQARPLTLAIGLLEMAMAVWIFSGIKARFCAVTQMAIVTSMNVLEFWLAPDLLLWGRMNLVFALLFVGLVYFSTFVLDLKQAKHAAP